MECQFDNEFNSKAETTIETIKACVTEMTSFFVSSEKMQRAFSPKTIEECDFLGFEECINEGKIVVLALNAAEYPEVSKSIAAYMKLDFQSEIMQRTSKESLNKDGGEVVKAINRIEKRYKSRFFSIFKSITSDNGTEFTDT